MAVVGIQSRFAFAGTRPRLKSTCFHVLIHYLTISHVWPPVFRHVNAYSIRPLDNHNELTYHLSQIMFQHAHFTLGDAATPAAAAAANQAGAGFTNNMDPGMQPVDAEVDSIFKDFETNMGGNDAGFTVQDVVAASNNRLNADAVMKSIHRLVDAGHLYVVEIFFELASLQVTRGERTNAEAARFRSNDTGKAKAGGPNRA